MNHITSHEVKNKYIKNTKSSLKKKKKKKWGVKRMRRNAEVKREECEICFLTASRVSGTLHSGP